MDGGDTLTLCQPEARVAPGASGSLHRDTRGTRSERARRLRAGRPAGEGSGSGDKHQVQMAGTLFRE